MGEPLYARKLHALDHRLLWWLLAHQEVADGVPTGIVRTEGASWRVQAQADLKTHRPKLWAAIQRLRAAGVIESAPYSREVRIMPEAFQ